MEFILLKKQQIIALFLKNDNYNIKQPTTKQVLWAEKVIIDIL